MNTKEYVRDFLKALSERDTVCKKLRWDIETYGSNHMEATTQISTVVGKRNLSVVFLNGTVYPIIILADGVERDNISDEVWVSVLEKMNNVNHLYSNLVVAFYAEQQNRLIFFLRGRQAPTAQDNYSNMSEYEWDGALTYALSSVANFCATMNEDFGTSSLEDLMNMFH